MLLVIGDFTAKVGRRQPSAAVGLYGVAEINEAAEQLLLLLGTRVGSSQYHVKQHPRRLYAWTSGSGDTRNQIDYISIAQRWKTSLMNCRTYPGADCDNDHLWLMATLKVRLANIQRQHSIPFLNVDKLKEEKTVRFAAVATNRFTASEAAHD